MRLVFLGVLTLFSLVYGQETCQSADEEPYLLFATKTAYTFASVGIPLNKVYDVPGCQPLAIWLLNRHGSHNPEADEIANLQKLTDFRNNIITNYRNANFRETNMRMCTSDVNLLERWQWNPRQNTTFAGDLTSDGYISTQQLAQAWKQKFPGLLTDNLHDYMPYKFCPSWTSNVDENNDTLTQLRIFESKQEYREMISNISKRLGFNYDIQKEMIHYMYDMCRYNKAWDITQISPWCAVFTKEDLKRLEYAEDLEMYYKYGYGTPMNQQVGCTGVKDMMDFFKIHVERNTPQQPRASIHFTEAPMILLTMAALGARRDSVPLTGDNYHSAAIQARKWSTSTMTPFNANLGAVLYKCQPDNNFRVEDPYQVLFLENERPINLEDCKVGLCNYTFVKTRFGLIADNCNMHFCNSANKINEFGFSLLLLVVVKML